VPFSKDTIGSILTNPFYVGRVRYNGEERDGKHEALIDRALWDEVQALRTERAHNKSGGG
jgi:site-specific DNA recombinase